MMDEVNKLRGKLVEYAVFYTPKTRNKILGNLIKAVREECAVIAGNKPPCEDGCSILISKAIRRGKWY